MNEQEQKLKDIMFSWTWTVDRVLKETQNRKLFGTPSPTDQMRLLSLRTWCFKYKLDLEQILNILIPIWTKRFERFKKHSNDGIKSLGCKIATLCGDKSEQILISELKKLYPNDEYIQVWKSREQEKQLRRNEDLGDRLIIKSQTIEGFVDKYKRTILRERKDYLKKINSGKFTKRKYPGSPWAD